MGVKGTQAASGITIANRRTAEDEKTRNVALKRAIGFSKVPLLTNLIYFAWRWVSVFKCAPNSSGAEIAAYIAFLVVEWIFAGWS